MKLIKIPCFKVRLQQKVVLKVLLFGIKRFEPFVLRQCSIELKQYTVSTPIQAVHMFQKLCL